MGSKRPSKSRVIVIATSWVKKAKSTASLMITFQNAVLSVIVCHRKKVNISDCAVFFVNVRSNVLIP